MTKETRSVLLRFLVTCAAFFVAYQVLRALWAANHVYFAVGALMGVGAVPYLLYVFGKEY